MRHANDLMEIADMERERAKEEPNKPLFLHVDANGRQRIAAGNSFIADLWPGADAALIVAAVNSYDAHRALVKAARIFAENEVNIGPNFDALRAALALIEAAEKGGAS